MPSATSLRAEPHQQRRLEPEPRGEPAADEVRDDAEDLVEEEQRGDLERAVAQLVEVEEHEHADRAVGDRVGPVGAGDERVVAQVDGAAGRGAVAVIGAAAGSAAGRLSATVRASSTRRFA